MVQVKQRIRRTIPRIPHLPQHASNPKVSARMHIPRDEIRRAFELVRKAGIILLREQARHELRVREPIHDPRHKVAAQTVPLGDINVERGRREGPIRHAPAAGAARDVEPVLGRGRRALGAVAAEAEGWVEYLRGEDGGGVWR